MSAQANDEVIRDDGTATTRVETSSCTPALAATPVCGSDRAQISRWNADRAQFSASPVSVSHARRVRHQASVRRPLRLIAAVAVSPDLES